MTPDREAGIPPAGGPVRHRPVLLEAVLAALAPQAGEVHLDGTFGAGGYTRAILKAAATRVIALDRDPAAVAGGATLVAEAGRRLTLAQARFGDLDTVAAEHGAPGGLDGVVLDIGVSSMQLDQEERGFSFRADGPLDMRMEGSGQSAADLVNTADADTLADILFHYGEERASRRIARAIVHDRLTAPYTRTKPLADMIARVVPRRNPGDIHPATRSFQALRIAVNDELGELVRGLLAAERALKPGGRLVVVTFHSLEDRIVKRFLATRSGRAGGDTASRHQPAAASASAPSFALLTRQPVGPGDAEVADNPRARSAKLRAGRRTPAPPMPDEDGLAALATLPDATRPPSRSRR